MALTAVEEAQLRDLIAQQSALLSLAGVEATILSKLGATKVTLSDLPTASAINDADLLLLRQGVTDKSVTGLTFKGLIPTVADASETVKGVVELATSAEVIAGTDTSRAITAAGLNAAAVQKSGSTMTGSLILHANPTVNLQAATKQYVDASTGGFTFLGPIVTTSGQTQSLSGLNLTNYKLVLFIFYGVSTSGATKIGLGTATICNQATSATESYGNGWLDLSNGVVSFSGGTDGSNSSTINSGYSNATTSLVFDADVAGAGTFDKGLIRVYGVK